MDTTTQTTPLLDEDALTRSLQPRVILSRHLRTDNRPSLEERKEVLGDDHSFHPLDMPAAYAVRDGGDAKNKKQSMADLKLRRLNELNLRLKEDLDRPRVKVAEASMSLISYCNSTRDYMVPSVWGQIDKKEDPYLPQQDSGCCSVM